jgi:hypothetical protein
MDWLYEFLIYIYFNWHLCVFLLKVRKIQIYVYRRFYFWVFAVQSIPVKIFKEWVLFDFTNTFFLTDSFIRVDFEHFV